MPDDIIPEKVEMTVTTNVNRDLLGKPEDYLNVMIPTANNMIAIHTAVALGIIQKGLGKGINYIPGGGMGVVAGRNACFDIAKHMFGVDKMRILFIDSDVAIMNPDAVVEYIKRADAENFNFVANYKHGHMDSGMKVSGIKNTIYNKFSGTANITDEELEKMPDLAEIAAAGLGFFYGMVDLDYEFYQNRTGEDFHFFRENALHIRLAKGIRLKHKKDIWI